MGFFDKRKLLPSQQKIYDRAFKVEAKRIAEHRNKAMVDKLQAKARSDAAVAAMPKLGRAVGGLLAVQKVVSSGLKKLPPIDEAKLTAAVCGTPKKKERQ
jgi:GTP1/Obg family GTP-binding protein